MGDPRGVKTPMFFSQPEPAEASRKSELSEAASVGGHYDGFSIRLIDSMYTIVDVAGATF